MVLVESVGLVAAAAAAAARPPPATLLTSASGIISLLDEQRPEIKIFALTRLNEVVDDFWAEISDIIAKIEVLYEDAAFSQRKLAALLASRVYYHLGDFEDSLTYALGAGELFDVTSNSEYVETIVTKCIDHYTKQRLAIYESSAMGAPPASSAAAAAAAAAAQDVPTIDARLEDIVNRMVQRCFDDKQYKQALGIGLETRRDDILQRSITESEDVAGMLAYAQRVVMNLIDNRAYRNDVLRLLVDLYRNLRVPDYVNMIQCLIFLDDAPAVADLLDKLTRGKPDETLMAFQIAFDLYESATQQFLNRVLQSIRTTAPIPSLVGPDPTKPKKTTQEVAAAGEADESASGPSQGSSATAAAAAAAAEPESMETDEPGGGPPASGGSQAADATQAVPKQEDQSDGSGPPPVAAATSSPAAAAASITEAKRIDLSESERTRQDRLEKLAVILGGETTIGLQLQFLIRNNKSDPLILKQTKESVRNSVVHTATVVANGFQACGTTSDQFLRDNLEWLSRAVNWSKFSAIASLGVIHKGHEGEALHLMSAYLPREAGPGSGYTEGGSLYALGLIHANHGRGIIDYLCDQLKSASNEPTRHGGCLGLGLAAMGTHRADVYDIIKLNLMADDAVVGEAAGIAMGLVMLGSKSPQAIEDMIGYAQDTQHEKILRGLALGLALTMFGLLEEADTLIETLSRDKDALLRRAGMHTIAMAYCGSGNNRAIRRLLHVAVSDTNDDVRRAAVEAIGFVLFRTPEVCPSVVSLLSESYNPHVRYGAAMALGICCAGTGSKEALSLLEPMLHDPTNYVRQGATVASALVLIQQNENTCPKVKDFRAGYAKVIGDKHEDVMAKFGAILAQGIIDGGGRNVTVSLQSRTGHTNVAGVVGLLVFTGFWYWYPLSHFLSLAFVPTCVIGLNADLKMPKMQIKSAARPSLYAYPPPLEEKREKEREKVATAVLSITNKMKKKEAEKAAAKKEEKMQVDEASPETSAAAASSSSSVEAKESPAKSESAAAAAATAAAPGKEADEKTPSDAQDKDKEEKEDKDKKEKEDKDKKEKEPEAAFEMLDNPARVMRAQLRVLEMDPAAARYQPVKDLKIGGVILFRDTRDSEPADLVVPVAAGGPKLEEDKEPEPPEPFEYIEE